MKIAEILSLASRNGVKLWVEKGRLRYQAKRGALTFELRQLITENREGILACLLGEPSQRSDVHGLSYNQQFLWFQYQLAPSSAAYNVAFVARIISSVNLDRIREAFQELVNRHPILRTTYENEDGVPTMRVHDTMELTWEVVDTVGWDSDRLHEEVRQRYSRPFDLARGPVCRVSIFRSGPNDHVILLTVHHIACDGRSIGILLNEFRDLYVKGPNAELPPLRGAYVDFSKRQAEMVKGPEGERLFDFWRQKLSSDIPELDLPGDRPRPSAGSPRGGTFHFGIDGELYHRIVSMAKESRATLYTLLLSSFQVLLMRLSSQEDILIGTPMSGRLGSDDEGTVGCFVNPVVMRGTVRKDSTFRELLRLNRKAFAEALEHRHYPFSLIVERLNPIRGVSRSPFFRVMFNLLSRKSLGQVADLLYRDKTEERTTETVDFGGLKLKPFTLDQEEGQFDLMLEMIDDDRSLTSLLKYNKDIFHEQTIARLARHFETLLNGIAADMACPVSDLPLLEEEERNRILVEWNRTEADYPQDACLHRLFEDMVERNPDKVAVECEGESLTYLELNVLANRLAHRLRALGVGPEVMVGVHLERSLEMVIAIYAVLKAGGAYVPLDPELPAERLAFMISEIKAPVIISFKGSSERLPAHVGAVLHYDHRDESWRDQDRSRDTNPENRSKAENAAYVIYTSGSTGDPKGVINTHRGICNRLFWMQDAFGLAEHDVVLQKTPFSFDVSVWELFWPLITGAKLVMAKPGGHRDSAYLAKLITGSGATTVHFVPSMLDAFLDDQRAASCERLKRVICSGEALSYELQERFFSILKAELHNLYGPTEAAVDVTWWACRRNDDRRTVPIGRPISNTRIYILDDKMQPVPVGVAGELYIGGVQVARGYLNRPDLTAERFIPDPFSATSGATLYRTGDLCRFLQDGDIEYIGRNDFQVKIRGFRIELGDIESHVRRFPGIRDALVTSHRLPSGEIRLIAYFLMSSSAQTRVDRLRSFLRARLPDYMIPTAFVKLSAFPTTSSGKIDRKALPIPETARQTEKTYVVPRGEIERRIAALWKEVLGVDRVGLEDNFFDLGGHSLLLIRLVAKLNEEFAKDIEVVDLFQHPTVREQARLFGDRIDKEAGSKSEAASADRRNPGMDSGGTRDGIAVIGIACRFPGADSVDRFWQNLREGIESIRRFSDQELADLGISPKIYTAPGFIKAAPILDDIDKFDAAFFGYSPREAEIIDPQQRFFLECAWAALENAGYDPSSCRGSVGVFAGVSPNYYSGGSRIPLDDSDVAGIYQREIGNEKDYLSTRVSYKLNLKGPSLAIQTACSTSLVATHVACQHLMTNQCDMALAGGVSINVRMKGGYFYQEGMIPSPDGHCRAFDEKAQGTVVGQGVGVVVLKRLLDAIEDGDEIHAVIRGSAVNNDGSARVGFTAPSVEGQSEVIAKAISMAGISPEDIGYIEAHGTGTPLGDPIEVKALTKAFRSATKKKGFCAIGSVKTNIGHLDAAAGVAGLIKTALILKNGEIPPSLHYEKPNPNIDFENSPFYVNTRTHKWANHETPRRAGVSSFGLGGTNCHMVLEEAPRVMSPDGSRSMQLLPFSARSPETLKIIAENMINYLQTNPDIDIADAAFTLQAGRKAFDHRQTIVCPDIKSAISSMSSPGFQRNATIVDDKSSRDITFMFSGQGSQYANMGFDLYREERVFREQIDRCAEFLRAELDVDFRSVVFTGKSGAENAEDILRQTRMTQPVLFAIEFALAQQWLKWGIRPQSLVGHSIGEYTAACLAEVFSLEQGLKLVATRGRLMQEMATGSMLAVPLGERDIAPFLNDEVTLAAHNGPMLCVVAGETEAIDKLETLLESEKIACRRVQTSHAFHSKMMEPVMAPFSEEMKKVDLNPPKIPFLSNVTGTWITTEQATDPDYWSIQLRRPVRFSDCVSELLKDPSRIFLEVGPGRVLNMLVSQRPDRKPTHQVLSTTRHPKETRSDITHVLETLGALWRSGIAVDWEGLNEGRKRRRIPLPTYPFERKRYWMDISHEGILRPKSPDSPLMAEKKSDAKHAPSEAEKAGRGESRGAALGSPFASETERLMADIWKDLLNLDSVGPDDNYFELGGSSLFAVRLFDQVERVYNKRLPLAILFQAPTLRELSAKVGAPAGKGNWSSLVEINKGDPGTPPLFLVHSEGGNVLEYWPLSKYFPPGQPVHALQAKGLDGETIISQSVEEMAMSFIAEMRSIQPEGPYYLGGYCLGGLVAYEMSRQLTNMGERTTLLTMISTMTPDYVIRSGASGFPLSRLIGRIVERARMETRNISVMNWNQIGNYLKERMMRLMNLMQVNVEHALDHVSSMLKMTSTWHSRDYNLFRSILNQRAAFFNYQPAPSDMDVILFRVENRPSYFIEDATLGWSQYIQGDINVCPVDAFHKNVMKEPNIRQVGVAMSGFLRTAQARAATDKKRDSRGIS